MTFPRIIQIRKSVILRRWRDDADYKNRDKLFR